MSVLASASVSVRAIRFRSAPRLQGVFLLPLGHPSAVLVQSDAPHAALIALPHFPVVQPRDLQRHLTKRCSLHLLMPWLPRSSESVPRSAQHGQERSKRRFAKNASLPRRSAAKAGPLPSISTRLWWRCRLWRFPPVARHPLARLIC